MKHIEALEFLESEKHDRKSKKKVKWTEGYEYSELMLNFYQKLPLLSLPEALRLLDIYHQRVVKPAI